MIKIKLTNATVYGQDYTVHPMTEGVEIECENDETLLKVLEFFWRSKRTNFIVDSTITEDEEIIDDEYLRWMEGAFKNDRVVVEQTRKRPERD